MKTVYADIQPAHGAHIAGICTVFATPRQWLASDPLIDFETGRIITAIELKDNKFWIQLDLLQNTYDFQESPKDSKSGDYTETTFTGTLNYHNYMLRQQLETMRRCQWVVLLTDMNKRRRIVGVSDNAMLFKYNYQLKNTTESKESIQIDMLMQSEDPAPFYNPDNEPEIIYNLLEDIDGNFLLVE